MAPRFNGSRQEARGAPALCTCPARTRLLSQDKTFVPDNILTQDPTWQWGQSGRLWYPHVYEPTSVGGTGPNPSCADNPKGRWDYGPCATPKAVLPSNAFYTLPTPASVVAEA